MEVRNVHGCCFLYDGGVEYITFYIKIYVLMNHVFQLPTRSKQAKLRNLIIEWRNDNCSGVCVVTMGARRQVDEGLEMIVKWSWIGDQVLFDGARSCEIAHRIRQTSQPGVEAFINAKKFNCLLASIMTPLFGTLKA